MYSIVGIHHSLNDCLHAMNLKVIEELDYVHFPIFLDYLIPFAKVADTPCTLDAYLKAKERYHLASQLSGVYKQYTCSGKLPLSRCSVGLEDKCFFTNSKHVRTAPNAEVLHYKND